MSASKAKESKLSSVSKLGIIAGSGQLPHLLVATCQKQNITPYILAFDGHTDHELVEGLDHIWTHLGALQKNINWLKSNDVQDLVFCGGIKRPSIRQMKPDFRATKFFARHSLRALGDSDLLSAVKQEIAKDGFTMHGVHDFIDDILTGEGTLGTLSPSKVNESDIKHGMMIAQEIGRLDIGQAVVIQDGVVIGVEGVEGTDALIKRVKPLLKKSKNKGVLVKACKPQQDKDLDLPTIGIDTIQNISESGLAGVAVHANNSLILDPQAVTKCADRLGVFVYGAKPS